ncbi:MAG: chemotaxis response regulator protein-glutamate methylesterase [Lachnospiraceae bacterium]|nr:chemotaxis response regulator protein-glutamate methylesterase [Lachnospiraceae bacterium]MBP5183572.1 chemotaxis response regulator protein-glutamate methylesterase [Lachnospiraceae bacterium]
MKKIRVLVVDDSRLYRELLADGINQDPALEVVATAGDAYEARDAIIATRPDVMTLDVEMPGMNGIEFLRRLLPQYSLPVVMVSSLNEAVFDAMSAGAVDFVDKPKVQTSEALSEFVRNELNAKIKIASIAKVPVASKHHAPGPQSFGPVSGSRLIAIGASTGGTEAILSVISAFGKDTPGTVVVQHMPAGFTKMYAERLDRECEVSVREAKDGDEVKPGTVLIAPGELQMRVERHGDGYRVKCTNEGKISGHNPSVNVLFESVAAAAGKHAIGVILTGMGADGSDGLLNMRNAGAATIGESERSCIVYGMPQMAKLKGGVEWELDLEEIPDKINEILKHS